MLGQDMIDVYCRMRDEYWKVKNRCKDLENQCRMQQEQIQHMRNELKKPRDFHISVDSQEWVFCKERYPVKELREHLRLFDSDDVEVIVWVKDADVAVSLYFNGRDFYDSEGVSYDVIAWMPMPGLPVADSALDDGE